jgi:hypothetical protein
VVDRKDQQAARKGVLMHAYAAYGADPRRWPPAAQRWLNEGSVGGDGELVKARQEACELDRLLDAASRPRVPAGAAERAIATILSEEAQSGDVVNFDLSRKAVGAWHGIGIAPISSAAALAAALVLGIYFGASGLGDRLIPSASSSTSLANTDYDVVKHVLADLQEDMG